MVNALESLAVNRGAERPAAGQVVSADVSSVVPAAGTAAAAGAGAAARGRGKGAHSPASSTLAALQVGGVRTSKMICCMSSDLLVMR